MKLKCGWTMVPARSVRIRKATQMARDKKPELRVRYDSFSDEELQTWRNGEYLLVKDCSRLLKERLRAKARARPGRRFFGEAKVLALASEQYEAAWYGSFKWLTSPKWIGRQALGDRYQEGFRAALQDHFHGLAAFQQAVARAIAGEGRRAAGRPRSLADFTQTAPVYRSEASR